MQVNLTGHHVDITEPLRAYVDEKIARLERHFEHVTNVHVILSVEKLRNKAEATIHVNGADLFADAGRPLEQRDRVFRLFGGVEHPPALQQVAHLDDVAARKGRPFRDRHHGVVARIGLPVLDQVSGQTVDIDGDLGDDRPVHAGHGETVTDILGGVARVERAQMIAGGNALVELPQALALQIAGDDNALHLTGAFVYGEDPRRLRSVGRRDRCTAMAPHNGDRLRVFPGYVCWRRFRVFLCSCLLQACCRFQMRFVGIAL